MRLDRSKLSLALRRQNPRWRLRDCQPLSRRAHLLQVDADEPAQRFVLLGHSPADLARNPHIARLEFQLLQTLRASKLPVALAIALLDELEPPCLITTYINGAPRWASDDLPGFCQQLAETLSAIHAVDSELACLPRLNVVLASQPSHSDARIQAALRANLPGLRRNPPTLLHGDFWLGNLLWQGQELSGIIDWEDAMLGDPLADLGKSRLEMLWALGWQAMTLATDAYLALNPALNASGLPVWDLWGAARLAHFGSFAADAAAASRMSRQYARFVASALEALPE